MGAAVRCIALYTPNCKNSHLHFVNAFDIARHNRRGIPRVINFVAQFAMHVDCIFHEASYPMAYYTQQTFKSVKAVYYVRYTMIIVLLIFVLLHLYYLHIIRVLFRIMLFCIEGIIERDGEKKEKKETSVKLE